MPQWGKEIVQYGWLVNEELLKVSEQENDMKKRVSLILTWQEFTENVLGDDRIRERQLNL